MATTQCPYCGNPVRVGAAFCANCGHTLPTTQSLISAPLQPGMLLHNNRYRIEKRLGKGGAGDVYLARDSQLFNRPVVVKRLRVQETDPQDRIEAERNFTHEAQALAELNNPRFPQVLDFFTDAPMQYLVMEFVAGENLDDKLEKQGHPLTEDQVLDIGQQMASLLVYLHGQNPPIIHRDVKPANIIIDHSGQITLVDFGIARAKAVKGDGRGGVKADSAAWGTPGYAPPEQVAGHAEPRSDIHALGATLLQLLTGYDPREHIGEPFPAAAQLNPAVSPAMSDLLARMLNPEPGRRPDARAVMNELVQIDNLARVARTTGSLAGALPATAPPPAPGRPVAAPPTPGAGGPYAFPSGDQATSLAEFARLADRNWDSARDGLYSGRLAQWLRAVGDTTGANDAAAIVANERDHDVGLESFLERIAPGLAPPRLGVQPDRLDLGTVRPGQRQRNRLRLANTSRGALRARLHPSDSWISVNPDAVTLRGGETHDVEVIATAPASGGGGNIEVSAGPAGTSHVAVLIHTRSAPAPAPPPPPQTAAPAQSGSNAAGNVFRLMILLGLGALLVFALQQGWFEQIFAALPGPTRVASPPTAAPATAAPAGPITFGPADWSQPGYDAGHTSFAPVDFGVPTRVAGSLTLDRGSGPAEPPGIPLIAGRTAFVGFNTSLGAYNLDTPQTLWTRPLILPGVIASLPLDIVGKQLIVGNALGLAAYATDTGKLTWQAVISKTAPVNFVVAPAAAGAPAAVYLASSSRITAYTAQGGIFLWDSDRIEATKESGLPAVGTDTVYVGNKDWAAAFARQDGKLRWAMPLSATQSSPPVVGPTYIYMRVTTPDGKNELRALNKADGSQVWSFEAPAGASGAPALADDVLFISGDREVTAVDATTGQARWLQAMPDVGTRGDALLPEPPLVTNRFVYVASDIGKIFAVDRAKGTVNTTDAFVLANRPTKPAHNPIVANGRMYVVTSDGTLYEIAGR